MSMDNNKYDALVVGGGIAGQEAALNLADMDYKVLLVEKELSIGGKMIQLSKVFPTLDCAACITTPKMSETARHPNIKLLLNSSVETIEKQDRSFEVKINRKPRYVKAEACTGCQQCEFACPEIRPDDYNARLAGRKVAYIPFTLANPRIASIDRQGTSSPCINECPGGVKAYGFISLVRNGQYEEAMNLHLEDIPLPASLSRACFAPCQTACTRVALEGPVDIRRTKRYFTDYYYSKYPDAPLRTTEKKSGKRVAIIGSGPAGLTAAYHLALKGHSVKIFEAEAQLGGMLKLTIPGYRLPNYLVDRDIQNILSLGVDFEVNKRITSIKGLKESGNFDSVFVAVGTNESSKIKIEGAELTEVTDCLEFLRNTNLGNPKDLTNKKVVVLGGGNVAMDVSRTAVRQGAEEVSVVCLEERGKMLALDFEVNEAIEEGVKIYNSSMTTKIFSQNNRPSLEFISVSSFKFIDGKPEIKTVSGSEKQIPADVVILAVGLRPSTAIFKDELELTGNGKIVSDEKTLQTSIKYLFAGGDSHSGASSIIQAAGEGKRAAFYIDKYLNGGNPSYFEFGDKLPAKDKNEVLARKNYKLQNAIGEKLRPVNERIKDFNEIEMTFTEEEVLKSTERCLDCSNCRECHQCANACPADAIDFSQKSEVIDANVKSVIISTGYKLFKPENKPQYGYKLFPNVIDSMQMDRLIAPTRPFNNVLRPGDGKVPDKIAYILCTGSRDSSIENSMGCSSECSNNPICSQICCMYSIKQAQLLMGALPMADITIYYMDIRAFGKGYEEFFQQTKSMGVSFIKGKVAQVKQKDDGSGDLVLRYEDVTSGVVKEATHDVVVLSVGVLPDNEITKVFTNQNLLLDDQKFIKQVDELISPSLTSIEGVFAAGTSTGPKDIPDSILSAGSAASEAACYIGNL